MTPVLMHRQASELLRSVCSMPRWFATGRLLEIPGEHHRLEFPTAGTNLWPLVISFTEIEGDDEGVWVRSTNWRAEDEPCGWLDKPRARALYKALLAHGMQPF